MTKLSWRWFGNVGKVNQMEDSSAKSYKGWLMITLGEMMIKDWTLRFYWKFRFWQIQSSAVR